MKNLITDSNQKTFVLFSRKNNKPFPKLKDIKRVLGITEAKFYKSSGKFQMYAHRLHTAYRIAFEPLMTNIGCLFRSKFECTDILVIDEHINCNFLAILEFEDVLIDGFNVHDSTYDEITGLCLRHYYSLQARSSVLNWTAEVRKTMSIFNSRKIIDLSVSDFNLSQLEEFENTYAVKALQDATTQLQSWVEKNSWRKSIT
jgi:hypothetical protein